MFCCECGKPARGKFCSHCGTRLDPEAEAIPVDAETVDWENEVRYDVLLKAPHVRRAIDRHAALAKKRMTGEQFMALCEKVVSLPVPAEAVVGIIQPISRRLGLQTGKQRAAVVAEPPGRVLCRILCSLARNGQAIRQVRQAPDGCVIEAALPSDIRSLEGDLVVTVGRDGGATAVSATTKIDGQLFDWGKSRRCLDELFDDVCDIAAEAA